MFVLTSEGSGSGVVFGGGLYLLTAHHVVANGTIMVIRPGITGISGTVVWSEEQRDLAIVKLEREISVPDVVFMKGMGVRKRQDVFALGFPSQMYRNEKSIIGVKATKGIVSAMITDDQGVALYQFDAPANSGNSGGPLVDGDGKIVGIVTHKISSRGRTATPIEGIAYAVSIDEALPAIESLGIPYTAEPSDEEKVTVVYGASSMWAKYKMEVIIALMVIVVAVGVVIVMRQRSASNAEMGRQAYAEMGGQAYAGMRGQSSVEQPVLIGVGADRREVVYPLQRGHVTIGRDAQQCNVVLSDPAVSKRHCIVEYREMEGAFVVRDCQSTNGTFLMSGKRLQAGSSVQLRSGDSFYLVDPSRTYTVRKESRRVV